jgi:hypothetical protein
MATQVKNIKSKVEKINPFLSDEEEDILMEAAKIASSKAIRSSMALGLKIKVIRDREIIEINPDRSETVIGKIPNLSIDLSSLKKGMILQKKYS